MTSKKITTLCLFALGLLAGTSKADVIQSWDFNTDGNFEGWTTTNADNLSVSGGFLIGDGVGGDPRLQIESLSLDTPGANTWSTLVFNVREFADDTQDNITNFDPQGVVVLVNGNNFSGTISATDLGGGVFDVTADISSLGSTQITDVRVDPIGAPDANNNTFFVDCIRVSAVPEPGSISLLGLLGVAVLARRRR